MIVSGKRTPHYHARLVAKPLRRFCLTQAHHPRREFRRLENLKSMFRIEGGIPRYVAECRECCGYEAVCGSPITYMFEQGCPDPATTKLWKHVQLVNVKNVVYRQNNDEANGDVVVKKSDPNLALTDKLRQLLRIKDLAIQISEYFSPFKKIARTRFDLSEAFQFV